MKKILLSLLIALPAIVFAQNVGIGTTAPSAKLEVHNPLNSIIKISSNSYNDTARLVLSNRDNSGAGTDFILTAPREQGLLISTRSDLPNNNSDSLFVLQTTGRLGLGIKNPAAKLDVDGGARIAGFNTIELGGGVAGKEVNAGKIGYRTYTADALDIVGAGTGTSDRKVHFYAEGGTTFNGSINTGGSIQINGNSGLPGQVLSSNGTAAPDWVNAAYSSNDRFGVTFAIAGSQYLQASVLYNLNATDIAVVGPTILLYKSGLYHFNGAYTCTDSIAAILSYDPSISLNLVIAGGLNYSLPLESYRQMPRPIGTPFQTITNQFSQDIYITAPTTLRVFAFFTGTGTNDAQTIQMSLFGNRVSD